MSIFIKENPLDNDSLLKEIKGLKLIQENLNKLENTIIRTPKIITYDKSFIKMEKVNQSFSSNNQQKQLGIILAKLHKIKQNSFGFDEDNYIGLSKQKNILSENWGEFFYNYRLLFQINLIKEKPIKEEFLESLINIKPYLIKFLNATTKHPSLVHGDLWSGNVLFSKDEIFLIDPAVYYGDREVDIAMSEMFGGFNKEFYSAYNQEYPLSYEYEKKKNIYNLYHFLNHYNLFGKSYLANSISLLNSIKTLF